MMAILGKIMTTYRDFLYEEMRVNGDKTVMLEQVKVKPWFLGEEEIESQQSAFLETHWLDGDDDYWDVLEDSDRYDFSVRAYSENFIYILYDHPDSGRHCVSERRHPKHETELVSLFQS